MAWDESRHSSIPHHLVSGMPCKPPNHFRKPSMPTRSTDGADAGAMKARHFLGIARIPLDDLDFSIALRRDHRENSDRATSKLLSVFRLEGCHRLEEGNFIDAQIDALSLEWSLGKAQLSKEALRSKARDAIYDVESIPKLRCRTPLACMNGLQRTLAAKQYLDRNDQWWVVRLYEAEGLDSLTSKKFIEAYSHEQIYTDGEIFRKILCYRQAGDREAENTWWARLTDTKRKDLRQLLKDTLLYDCFRRLIDFPGLWPPIQLGTLHRLHALRCTEELCSYLQHIISVWTRLVPHEELRCHVDTITVKHLELYAPGISSSDKDDVARMMQGKLIFPDISPERRPAILSALISTKCLIPSLRTFFEFQKYLEPCTSILKILLGKSERKRSLWRDYSANYFEPAEFSVQRNEDSFVPFEGTISIQRSLGYVQLWLFCMRHFPEMTAITPKITPSESKVARKQNLALWQKLGSLALRLGFRTPQAVKFANQDPDTEHALHFLRTARPNWTGDLEGPIAEIARVLGEMQEKEADMKRLSFTNMDHWPRERRCGRPHDDDHELDKHHLFAPLLYRNTEAGVNITSLYVKRDMFWAFFSGRLSEAEFSMQAKANDMEAEFFPNISAKQPSTSLNNEASIATRLNQVEEDNRGLRERLQAEMQRYDLLHAENLRIATQNTEAWKCKEQLEMQLSDMQKNIETGHQHLEAEQQKLEADRAILLKEMESFQREKKIKLLNTMDALGESENQRKKLEDLTFLLQEAEKNATKMQAELMEAESFSAQQTAQLVASTHAEAKTKEALEQKEAAIRALQDALVICKTSCEAKDEYAQELANHRHFLEQYPVTGYEGNITNYASQRFKDGAQLDDRLMIMNITKGLVSSHEAITMVIVTNRSGWRSFKFLVPVAHVKRFLVHIAASNFDACIVLGTDGQRKTAQAVTNKDPRIIIEICQKYGACFFATPKTLDVFKNIVSSMHDKRRPAIPAGNSTRPPSRIQRRRLGSETADSPEL